MKHRTLIPIALLLAATMLSFSSLAQDDFKPQVVFLIRHAEKEDEPRQDPPLKPEGVARSQELARLIGPAGIKTIITSQFTRTKKTAEPLAAKLGLPPTMISLKSNPADRSQIAEESTREVVNKIRERPGENVLVVGHSNSVPDVIKMLGGDIAPTIDEKKFDDLFVVTVYAKGKAKVAHLKYGAE